MGYLRPACRRSAAAGLVMAVLAGCGARSVRPDQGWVIQSTGDLIQPSLVTARDGNGRLWLAAGYTDLSNPMSNSSMGLAIRSPDGAWQTYGPLRDPSSGYAPSGDAWLATSQVADRVYYVSLATDDHDQPDNVGDALAVAVIDFSSGAPVVQAPRSFDIGAWEGWDEPTIVATRPPGTTNDTVIVAGTPIGPDVQDIIGVLISNDGGVSFRQGPAIYAPGYTGHTPGSPNNTVVRPFLQQDLRPGQECHEYLAFGVYYSTALEQTAGVTAPACATTGTCRSLAESESRDCGETWSDAVFVVVDMGPAASPDYRGFSYAVANDGTRAVLFADQSAATTTMHLKRAQPGYAFSVQAVVHGVTVWADPPLEVVATSHTGARLVHPTLSASSVFAAVWVANDVASGESSTWFSLSDPSTPATWTTSAPVDSATDGVSCSGIPNPFDNYLGLTPEAPLGVATSGFAVAWTGFQPCAPVDQHPIIVESLP